MLVETMRQLHPPKYANPLRSGRGGGRGARFIGLLESLNPRG